MKSLESIMNWPLVYKLWMAPQAERKFAPIARHNDLSRVRRVLDVGCGPGTNTHHFSSAEYLGIDWSQRYIRDARHRHNRQFLVADVSEYFVPPDQRFDFILLNSLIHHIDAAASRRILSHLNGLLTSDGSIHIVELVLPKAATLARAMARADRGKFPRGLDGWRKVFTEFFDEAVFEPFDLKYCGVTVWNLVYFKGYAKKADG